MKTKKTIDFLAYKILKALSHNRNLKTDLQVSQALKHGTYDDTISKIFIKQIDKYIDYKNKSIVDVGCGTGDFAINLTKVGAKKVIGIDLNEKHIDSAELKAISEGVEKNTKFICTDFNTYQPNELFDIAFSLSAFEHIPSPLNSLKKIYECIKPGGVLLTIFGPLWFSPYGAHMWEFTSIPWVHFLFPEKVVLRIRTEYYRPDDPVEIYEDVRGHLNRMSVRKFIKYSKFAGFKIERIRLNPAQDKGKYRLANLIINKFYPLKELCSFQILAVLKKP